MDTVNPPRLSPHRGQWFVKDADSLFPWLPDNTLESRPYLETGTSVATERSLLMVWWGNEAEPSERVGIYVQDFHLSTSFLLLSAENSRWKTCLRCINTSDNLFSNIRINTVALWSSVEFAFGTTSCTDSDSRSLTIEIRGNSCKFNKYTQKRKIIHGKCGEHLRFTI